MTDLSYSALTDEQRARADYLFADRLLGSDPSAYVYELRQGEITGRRPLVSQAPEPGRRARPQLRIAAMPEPEPTPEQLRMAAAALDLMAERIVKQSLKVREEIKACG